MRDKIYQEVRGNMTRLDPVAPVQVTAHSDGGFKPSSIIEQDMAIGAVKDILDLHGIRTPFGWEIVIGMLLDECESHLEVRGYRSSAEFVFR